MTMDPKLLDACVSCGLCLSSCPTYVVEPLEQFSPRGRITGMRLHAAGELAADDPSYVESMETCVQCRACENVCPSGVQFGELMESARAEITAERPKAVVARIAEEAAFFTLANRGVLRAASTGLAAMQAVRADRLLPARLRVPRRRWVRDGIWPLAEPLAREHPVRSRQPALGETGLGETALGEPALGETALGETALGETTLGETTGETALGETALGETALGETALGETAWLFRGCVMDQWFRPVHQATVDVLAAAGQMTDTRRRGRCCGALSLHQGRQEEARALAQEVLDAYAGTTGPVVVDSAGCGAAMKEYGRLLGTPEAAAFAARVKDPTEMVQPDELPPMSLSPQKVGYLQSCHLRNVQKVVDQPLALLRAVDGLEVVVPADAPRCCGAGGAYSVLQPEFSLAIGNRLADSFRRAGVDHIVSGNPGCILQLENLGFTVEHTASVLARALGDTGSVGDTGADTRPDTDR